MECQAQPAAHLALRSYCCHMTGLGEPSATNPFPVITTPTPVGIGGLLAVRVCGGGGRVSGVSGLDFMWGDY